MRPPHRTLQEYTVDRAALFLIAARWAWKVFDKDQGELPSGCPPFLSPPPPSQCTPTHWHHSSIAEIRLGSSGLSQELFQTPRIQFTWCRGGTRSFSAFSFRKTTSVAESEFFLEMTPVFAILHTSLSPRLMQAEQSSLSKTLKKITGLLKYKNCKYFIYLSFFLLRLPLSLVTEFCLWGLRMKSKVNQKVQL